MQSGYQFTEAMQRAKHPPNPKVQDPNKPPEPERPKVVTPADDEIIKAISNKASKQSFDVNVRLMASAVSDIRAQQILQDFEGSFVRFSSPDMNSLKANKLTSRALDKLVYNFSFRMMIPLLFGLFSACLSAFISSNSRNPITPSAVN